MVKKLVLWTAGVSLLGILVAVSVTKLSPILRSVPPPDPLRYTGPNATVIRHITGDDYWYDVGIGRKPLFEREGNIGVAWETEEDGAQSVNYVPSCLVFDPSQQAAGYRRAVKELIERLSNPAQSAAANERLEALTGKQFGSKEHWRKWLAVNEPYLYWSAYSQKLEVDTGAAAVGEPTKISWKTCQMPFYHPF